jgi:diguanylate cyclase (GGDEF)-like protein
VRILPRRASLGRHLFVAVAGMLLPLVAVGVLGILAFRTTGNALEDFRAETVGQSTRIAKVRDLMVAVDDAGELYAESLDPALGERFLQASAQIDEGFDGLESLNSIEERLLVTAARARWETARTSIEAVIRDGTGDDNSLDPFHDHVDGAAALLSDAVAENVNEVSDEIGSLRARERLQFLASLLTLIVGSIVGGLLARRAYRSVTKPLALLEEAAGRFGSDDFTYLIDVSGDDELAHVSSAFNSMAEKLKVSREALHQQALHDQLTGLPNRTLFVERVERAIARAERRKTPVSAMYLDVDNFKEINDTFGHQAGDEVLIAVAERLKGALRTEDTASRLGGDEFGVLLEEDVDGATRAAERLIGALVGTYAVTAGELQVGVSIGVAARQGAEELDELLRQADAAMYLAKASGKGGWRVFGPDIDAALLGIRSPVTELQRAIDDRGFVVHYQPVLDLQSGRIDGVEALVRWDHPERGLLAPSEFLQEAEDTGHILAIDRWILREACHQVRAWQKNLPGAEDLSVHVNVSARTLQHPGLADEIAEVLRSSGLAPGHLILEITETTLVLDPQAAAGELTQLKALGVRVALDDFGTGFSSLSHLLRFPIDTIKIDRSFVSAVGRDEQRSQLVQAMIDLGGTLGLRVVAEGIETPDQLDFLRTIGCEQGQGYLFAKPLGAPELERFLREKGRTGAIEPSFAKVLNMDGVRIA